MQEEMLIIRIYGVEMCEDSTNDLAYFNSIYRESVELFAYLAKEYKLNPYTDIICHSEGYEKGIASNHADVIHWFSKHSKTMDDFRKDVANEIEMEVPEIYEVKEENKVYLKDYVPSETSQKNIIGKEEENKFFKIIKCIFRIVCKLIRIK